MFTCRARKKYVCSPVQRMQLAVDKTRLPAVYCETVISFISVHSSSSEKTATGQLVQPATKDREIHMKGTD